MSAPQPLSPATATALRARTAASGGSYLWFEPAKEPPAAGWPLLVFLHGAGERGRNLNDLTRYGPTKLLSGTALLTSAEAEIARELAETFAVLAPQCTRDEVWEEERLLALVDAVVARERVDRGRVYVMGLSMGGFGAWMLGMRHPARFAAMVAICGGGRLADIRRAVATQGDALRSLGVWAFHGARDRVVPLEESQRMIAALEQAGVADVRFTVYPDGEHDAWTAAFATRELYSWLLRHRR